MRGCSRSAGEDVLALMAIYFATRGLLLLCAYLLSSFGHHNFLHELANWDGLWYRKLANHGYPAHASYPQTTLGFFPLYPIAIWTVEPAISLLTGHDSIWSATVAGVLISTVGGAVATYYVYRLAADWWDRQTAFRAAVLFIVFPGSVVFSMVYSRGPAAAAGRRLPVRAAAAGAGWWPGCWPALPPRCSRWHSC